MNENLQARACICLLCQGTGWADVEQIREVMIKREQNVEIKIAFKGLFYTEKDFRPIYPPSY